MGVIRIREREAGTRQGDGTDQPGKETDEHSVRNQQETKVKRVTYNFI